jgi:hypothetical protein
MNNNTTSCESLRRVVGGLIRANGNSFVNIEKSVDPWDLCKAELIIDI